MSAMRLEIAVIFLSLTGLILPCSTFAAQTASELFASGTNAFAEEDYPTALAYFEHARDAGTQGPAVHFNIGVCLYRLNEFARAEETFRLVAERFPAMRPLAEYNLGLALLHQNKEILARRSFERVKDQNADSKLAALANDRLQQLDLPATDTSRQWVRLIDFGFGQDDNVLLVDEEVLPEAQPTDSSFTEILAVISGPFSTTPGFRFDGTLYSVRYDDVSQFNQNALRLGGSYHWRPGTWRMDAGPYINYSTLDGDGYEQSFGVGFRLRRDTGPRTTLTIRVMHDEVDSAESRFAYIDGTRDQISVAWDKRGTASRFTLAYDLELNNRFGQSVSPLRNGLSARYRYSMNPAWEADLWLALRSSKYDDLAITRDEDRTELSLGLLRTLSSGWQVKGRYLWIDNESNYAVFSYSRNRLVLGLTKTF